MRSKARDAKYFRQFTTNETKKPPHSQTAFTPGLWCDHNRDRRADTPGRHARRPLSTEQRLFQPPVPHLEQVSPGLLRRGRMVRHPFRERVTVLRTRKNL